MNLSIEGYAVPVQHQTVYFKGPLLDPYLAKRMSTLYATECYFYAHVADYLKVNFWGMHSLPERAPLVSLSAPLGTYPNPAQQQSPRFGEENESLKITWIFFCLVSEMILICFFFGW